MAQWVKGSGIAKASAQVTTVAQIQSLTQELPYAPGIAIKKKKKKKKAKLIEVKKKKKEFPFWQSG